MQDQNVRGVSSSADYWREISTNCINSITSTCCGFVVQVLYECTTSPCNGVWVIMRISVRKCLLRFYVLAAYTLVDFDGT